MTVLRHLVAALAAQHVDQMAGAEALAGVLLEAVDAASALRAASARPRSRTRAWTGHGCDPCWVPAPVLVAVATMFRGAGSSDLGTERDGARHALWADSARADVQALFEGTDDLVPLVVRQVASHISARELVRVRSLPMETLQSYTLYLGAEGLMSSLVRQDFMRCREVLEHLAERHPRQAVPHAMLAKWHVNHLVQVWSDDELSDQRKGMDHAARALDLDPEQPLALAAAGLVHMNLRGDMGAARGCLEKALQVDQQQAAAWAWLSAIQAYGGEHGAAQASAAQALALSPLDPERHVFEAYAALADIAAGQYAAAVSHASQSLRLHALHSPSHRLLVGSLWLAGQHDHARQAAQQWLHTFPGAHSGTRTARGLGAAATWREHFADAVRSAGVPSAPPLPRAPTQLS